MQSRRLLYKRVGHLDGAALIVYGAAYLRNVRMPFHGEAHTVLTRTEPWQHFPDVTRATVAACGVGSWAIPAAALVTVGPVAKRFGTRRAPVQRQCRAVAPCTRP